MAKQFIEPMTKEPFVCWIAPDGSIQMNLIAPALPELLGMTKVLHRAGVGQSASELRRKGFFIANCEFTLEPGQIIEADELIKHLNTKK